ncbi:hypothetical protein BKA65DRAFT_558782 [Rhexocercosporidium sp. MPI-PUGE-AT-0058]|nr:hypothetical protein BKA65DRAFT_558782 [Rhexocercosporidium sp. MPI-PUGE-AT-0058]
MASSASQEVISASSDFTESAAILGVRVIGLSNAYYLALVLNESLLQLSHLSKNTQIVVIDLSHEDLASKFGGSEKYGFSDLGIYRVSPKNFTGTPSPSNSWGPHPPFDREISDLPPWIKSSKDWKVVSLADAPNSAHLDPGRFYRFLRERCEDLGVKFILNSVVTSLERDDSAHRFTSATVQSKEPAPSTQTIPCSSVAIAAGPWSDRVFSHLFPSARCKLRMNTTRSAGNHFLARIPHWKPSDDDKGINKVFLNDAIQGPNGLDITSFLGGTLYVGGHGAKPETLSDRADSIEAQPEEIAEMAKLTRTFLRLEADQELKIINTGRCYRPLALPNRPIITKVPWPLLSSEVRQPVEPERVSTNCPGLFRDGLFINLGHNSDGVTL